MASARNRLATFFLGPGKTTLKAGDVVTAVHLPLSPKGSVGTYQKLGRNALSDLSIVGVTALGYPDSELPSRYGFRIALASVAPVPFVPVQAEAYLARQPVTPGFNPRGGPSRSGSLHAN